MFNDRRDASSTLNEVAVSLSDRRGEIAYLFPANRPTPVVEPDRTVIPATPAIPGPDAVRGLLILAAESAFELQAGIQDSVFLAQLKEKSENLTHRLAALPDVHQGVDHSFTLRRARQAVGVLNEAIRREVLDKIDENTAMDELEATLQAIKDVAADAGKVLAFMKVRDSGIR